MSDWLDIILANILEMFPIANRGWRLSVRTGIVFGILALASLLIGLFAFDAGGARYVCSAITIFFALLAAIVFMLESFRSRFRF